MSLRFSSVEAMEAAFGKKLRVRDSFLENNSVPDGSAVLSRAEKTHTLPKQASPKHAAPKKRLRRSPGATPHDILWSGLCMVFDGAVREFENAVPGRKYRLDIALPDARLAIEVDGWEWHGKHKNDFTRDRERQNLLTLHGWRILRFTAGQIRRDTQACIKMIEQACIDTENETSHGLKE